MDTRAFERIAAPFGVGSLDFMFLRDEYTRTIKGGSPAQPARACGGFSPFGGEGDYGGHTANWK
jgi:hypothetical protein